MAMPVVSVRADPRNAPLLRRIAARLRADGGFRLVLSALAGPPRPRSPMRGRRPPNRGAFPDEATALAVVLDRLVAALRPAGVYLFGSRAAGTAEPDSDFDLLVVLPDGACTSHDRVYAPLLGLGVGCDVVACTVSEFADEVRVAGTICHEATSRGYRLYAEPR